MRRRYIAVIGALVLLFLASAGIGYTVNAGSTPERTAALAEKVLERRNIDADDLVIIDSIDRGEYRMVWFLEDEENSLPMEFRIRKNGSLQFRHLYQPIERGRNVYKLTWTAMDSFFINNPSCETLRIIDADNNVTTVAVDGIPFVYWLDTTTSQYANYSYEFLDKDGNQIN